MQQLRIVWGAMLVSQLLFVFVVWYIGNPVHADALQSSLMIAMMAIGPAAVSLAWGRLFAVSQPPQARSLVRWASAEAVTLFGFVVLFMGGPVLVGGSLMAIGFLLILAQPPSGEPAT